MDIKEWLQILKEVGMPAVIMFWLFTEGSRNQRRLAREMSGIQQELRNLTIIIHDVITIAKAKGGF